MMMSVSHQYRSNLFWANHFLFIVEHTIHIYMHSIELTILLVNELMSHPFML